MPREKVGDPKGAHVQVSWKRFDEELPGNGYVQVSTHDGQAMPRWLEVVGEADQIMRTIISYLSGTEALNADEITEMCRKWQDRWGPDRGRPGNLRAELTGTYVALEPGRVRVLLDTLHKANRQSRPPGVGSTAELGHVGPVISPVAAPGWPGFAAGYPVTGTSTSGDVVPPAQG